MDLKGGFDILWTLGPNLGKGTEQRELPQHLEWKVYRVGCGHSDWTRRLDSITRTSGPIPKQSRV